MSAPAKKFGSLKKKPGVGGKASVKPLPKALPEKKKVLDTVKTKEEDIAPNKESLESSKPADEVPETDNKKSVDDAPLDKSSEVKPDPDLAIVEEEDQIEYINLDEIDGSESEEAPVKISEAVASMSDRVMDEDMLEYLKELGMKGAPDSLELEILKMPVLDILTTDSKQIRESRRMIIYPISATDLAHAAVQNVLKSDSCINFAVKCDRTSENHSWNGSLLLSFSTAFAATDAANEFRQMRRSLHIEQGGGVESKFERLHPQSSEKDWTESVLVVKNIGSAPNEKFLAELFPGADVVIRKDKRGGNNSKGLAYLLYGSAEQAKSALEKYCKKKIEVNNRRLILLKWRQTLPKIIPDGMLRIGERRLVMQCIDDIKTKLEKSSDRTEYYQAKAKFLQDLIDEDDNARKLTGLPLSTYEQLKKLDGMRQFGDWESTQILKRLLEPFDRLRDKEKDDKSKERDKDKNKERFQGASAKSKSKPGVAEKNKLGNKSDGKGGRSLPGKGKSSAHKPVPLLSTPMMKAERNVGAGLLGSGPAEPNINLLLHQQQRALVQPLLGSQSILGHHQSLLQSSAACLGVGLQSASNQINPLFAKQPGLLGSYPGEMRSMREYDDEPFQKISRYGTMQNIGDEDLLSRGYDDQDPSVHARDYDHGRRTGSVEDWYGRDSHLHYRDERDDHLERRRERDDEYFHKDMLASQKRNRSGEQVYRDERGHGRLESHTNARSLLSSLVREEEEGREYRREWDQRNRYDERSERRMQGHDEERMSAMEEDSSRRQHSSSDSSAKADPVSLLLNLSQLLAEKLQRDKDKGSRGGTY